MHAKKNLWLEAEYVDKVVDLDKARVLFQMQEKFAILKRDWACVESKRKKLAAEAQF